MKMLKEFKEFAMRGNVVDLAVGVIIGAAFGKVVTSVVSDIIMPPIGLLIGGMDFKNIAWVIREAVMDPATGQVAKEAVTIKVGNFIQTLVDFTIIAFAIFLLIKGINRVNRKQAEEPAAPPAPTREEELLTEIRDLLKK
jgi:large conductance mechanosensitive channel